MRPDLQRRMTKAALVYLPVYALASYLDLWTTHLALATSGTHEANAFLTTGRAYLSTRSWILTIGAGVLMIAGGRLRRGVRRAYGRKMALAADIVIQ